MLGQERHDQAAALLDRFGLEDFRPWQREAIDALPLPEMEGVSSDGWQDTPPTIEEVRALAETVECNVWSGQTQWMILQPTDQTVMVEVVTLRGDTQEHYDADLKYAMDQGALAAQPAAPAPNRYSKQQPPSRSYDDDVAVDDEPTQMDMLREQGCNEVQGFLFSRPLAVEAFEDFLQGFVA